MRKLWAAALALLSALFFLVVASPPASAFGSEVLGCSAGLGWTANTCSSAASRYVGDPLYVTFSPANTSGTYGTSWTVIDDGVLVTTKCVSINNVACISSGCTAGSMSCQVFDRVGAGYYITAYLTLTQSGQSRTVSAQAYIKPGLEGCRTC
ncbi:hypothetical protein [Jatrophihabitans sp.]|uniref:hypothetical protein n=1 Tax=Jatrophihabitans sp. TaxID=1932789 RepID=UPI002BEC9173|nr:hypothetical protein [Jatrophihabitans sp.]